MTHSLHNVAIYSVFNIYIYIYTCIVVHTWFLDNTAVKRMEKKILDFLENFNNTEKICIDLSPMLT